jgi:predicted TPR repeat methyltransferase
MTNFKQYSKYYDLLYNDKNYKEESEYIIRKIKYFSPEATQILELGSGSGSHAHFFCANGFEVTGIERSHEMVNMAKSKNIVGFNPIIGDITSYHLPQQFDVALSLFHVISYLSENDSLIDCFKATHKQLNTNGIFMFDIWYSPAVYHQKPETRIKRLENDEIEVIRIAESKIASHQNTVEVNFEVIIKEKATHFTENINEKHLMRHFSVPEIKMLAAFTGFEVLLIEEFLTEKAPSEDTWGVFFILKKL